MESDGSVAAASSASPGSSPPPLPLSPPAAPRRKPERKRSREAPRRHRVHRGGGIAKGARESAAPLDAVPAPGDVPPAAGTGEGEVEEKTVFVDEEAVFNLPELVEDMARGMLVAPPAIPWEEDEELDTCLIDLSLWKHD